MCACIRNSDNYTHTHTHAYIHSHTHADTQLPRNYSIPSGGDGDGTVAQPMSEFRLYTKARCIERHTHTHIKHKVYFV